MAAAETFVPVDAERVAAVRTSPPDFFLRDEFPDSEFPDELEVGDHAHAVFGPIAPVELPQAAAGELGTRKAEFMRACRARAGLDAAPGAIRGLGGVAGIVAARTAVFLAKMADAEGAIHAARGDHPDVDRPDFDFSVDLPGPFHAVIFRCSSVSVWAPAIRGR